MDNKKLAKKYLEKINSLANHLGKDITFMEICGGHTNVIMKYGIREILPKNIHLISGPGCPVCVTDQHDIDCMIELAAKCIPVATYGDMMKVPGTSATLDEIKAEKGNVFEIYSVEEVLELRKKYPGIVFFGIGFETTAPMSAYLLKNKICVYSVHKLIPPALEIISGDKINIDGFIDPGHVSTIIGVKPYRSINLPQVISGFEPHHILKSIMLLLEQITENRSVVINGYPEAVRESGNTNAQKLIKDHFIISDCAWRGLGTLPKSGLEVKDNNLNAKIKYKDLLDKVPEPKETGCMCGDVLKGLITPDKCPLYAKTCAPDNPKGACMVSQEGSCAIYFRYDKSD